MHGAGRASSINPEYVLEADGWLTRRVKRRKIWTYLWETNELACPRQTAVGHQATV